MTLPNFLLIGAAKSGTSSLYMYLGQHPEIFTSTTKEPAFFALEGQHLSFAGPGDSMINRVSITRLSEYTDLFRSVKRERAVGEASTFYLYSPQAPSRIRHYVPDVKLIAILRDPADRAHSNYLHMVRDGREPLPTFEEALRQEDARIAANWEHIWHYKQLGFYHEQLRRYFDLFERDQIAVYTYDQFKAEPLAVIRDIFQFLGVNPAFVPDMSARDKVAGIPRSNVVHAIFTRPNAVKSLAKQVVPASVRRSVYNTVMKRNIVAIKPRMAAETRRELVQLYREDIVKLQALLGRDLSKWLQA